MVKHTLNNGQSITVAADQWDGSLLAFAGTSNAFGQTPTAVFTGPNTLASIADIGSPTVHGQGAINLMPGSALTTGGLTVNAATLYISERPGTSMTLNGTSTIANGSTLTATGYAGAGIYIVNGRMNIDATSTVYMDYVAVKGTGTIHLTGNALLRAGVVSSTSETVVLDGGMLSLTNGMNFQGTITSSTPASSRVGALASVDVYNAMGAVRETFNRTTGMLGLFNAQGGQVASLKFAGSGDLYAAPTTGLATNYMAITSHPSVGALHVAFSA
jgi:hypothetical protein